MDTVAEFTGAGYGDGFKDAIGTNAPDHVVRGIAENQVPSGVPGDPGDAL
jgi:hypothetical protein